MSIHGILTEAREWRRIRIDTAWRKVAGRSAKSWLTSERNVVPALHWMRTAERPENFLLAYI